MYSVNDPSRYNVRNANNNVGHEEKSGGGSGGRNVEMAIVQWIVADEEDGTRGKRSRRQMQVVRMEKGQR